MSENINSKLPVMSGITRVIKNDHLNFENQESYSVQKYPVSNQMNNANQVEKDSVFCRQRLEDTINQYQIMMTETHHRVKNNLAAVSGLLQLQWLHESDPEIAEKFKDSFHRVNTIARIHEQLYQSGEFSNMNLADNLEKLVVSIIGTMQNDIDIDLDFHCIPIHLDTKDILPVSLIVNEVITNVMKYAFPSRKHGRIEVSLSEADNRIELVIRDNGIGLPEDFESRKKSSVGMNLIESLTNQLKAKNNYESSSQGTVFSLTVQRVL
jgi:two-component sensor histidine kinase